ncbi:VRR-NUC domain-containing protein [Shewanella sp. A3A]|nr:VRR-NUC domain-containing protein [Shewanella ferrihydritica]
MASARPELADRYYLDNFELLIAGTRRYHRLFPAEQAQQLAQFQALSEAAQRLLVRLLGRKGVWFRQSKLRYGDINDMAQALAELSEQQLLVSGLPPRDIWLQQVTLPELNQLPVINDAGLQRLPKAVLIQTLLASDDDCDSDGWLVQANQQLDERWWQIQCQGLLQLLQLLYFGNRNQDLTQFVVSELGLQRFEQYRLDASTQSFQQTDELQTALNLAQLADEWDELLRQKLPLDPIDFYQRLPKPQVQPQLERRRQRLVAHLGRSAERLNLWEFAVACYQQCQAWAANERHCRVLQQQLKLTPTVAIAEQLAQALNQLWLSASNEAAQQVAHRLAKRSLPLLAPLCAEPTLTALAKPLVAANHLAGQQQSLQLNADFIAAAPRVELRTAAYFEAQGYHVFFCENALLNGLFGLALWDIIFSPVAGAFHHPYQRAPQDMYSVSFYEQRAEAIEQRLAAIRAGDTAIIWRHFTEKQGLQNDWVNWSLLTETLLTAALAAFSPQFLYDVMRRLLKDPKHYRSGQPDLVLFSGEGECRFIEVKGPGDSLSDHQGYWLQFLGRYYPAELYFVDYA